MLDAVYAAPDLAQRISGLVGLAAQPTGTRGSYSFYDRPENFLGLHPDIHTCDVTLNVCLERTAGATPEVGVVRLYPAAARAPLEDITATSPTRDIVMRPGHAVVLFGGVIPHEVSPADDTFRRSIAVLCFRAERSRSGSGHTESGAGRTRRELIAGLGETRYIPTQTLQTRAP